MNLVFENPLEIVSIAAPPVTFAVSSIARNREVTWFEELLLIALCRLLAFFFVSPGAGR